MIGHFPEAAAFAQIRGASEDCTEAYANTTREDRSEQRGIRANPKGAEATKSVVARAQVLRLHLKLIDNLPMGTLQKHTEKPVKHFVSVFKFILLHDTEPYFGTHLRLQ